MKRYQVLVHSFVRNQPEKRWGQFLLNVFILCSVHVGYSYACKFIIGIYIYIKSRKVRRVPSLSHQRFSDNRGGELYFPQHMDIMFACQ